MGASTLMSLSLRALNANYAALQTTGHNIANANVAGYSRQQVNLESAPGQFTGSGYFGRGVNVTGVTRSHNEFLTRQAEASQATAGMDGARLGQLQQLETVFQTGEAGLGYAASQLFTALSDLSSRPSDLSARQVVLARSADLASRFNEAAASFDSIQTGVTSELKSSVADINALANSVAALNARISASRGLGQPANDLLDQRDQLINQISQQIQVTRVDSDDGSVGLFIGGGQRLVLGNEAAQLQVMQDPADSSRSAVGIVENGKVRALDADTLGGGAVAGLLNFQNNDLVAGRNLVGQLALAVGGALNTQQTSGLNLQGNAGAALYQMGAAPALPNANNARDGSGQFLGSATLTITDPGAVQASDYELRESTSTPGSWQLTRLSDGQVSTVNSGDVVDGMRIDLNGVQSGDRFLLQPAARAADGMKALLTDPRDVAAASPLVASSASTNTGTAAVAQLSVGTLPLAVPGATAHVTFINDAGDYTWDLVDSGNNVLSSGSGTWSAGATIPASAADINGFTMTLSGVPRSGDAITVEPTPASAVASNNGNAMALVGLRDAGIVGGHSFTDGYALALSNVGTRVQMAQTSSDISTAVATQAAQSVSSVSGVNLDEEAARLVQYQQSYQAAAKMMQTAQSLFDTLLDVVR